MTETKKRRSTVMVFLDLLREMVVFINLELNLAVAEIKRNIRSAMRGGILIVTGLFILLLGLLTLTCSLIAALAMLIPLWLAALAVGMLFVATGLWLLATGKKRVVDASPVPRESLKRVRIVSKKLMEK